MDGYVQVYVEMPVDADYEGALVLREEMRTAVGRESTAGGVQFEPVIADEEFEYEGFVDMLRVADEVIEFLVDKGYDFTLTVEGERVVFKAKPSQVTA